MDSRLAWGWQVPWKAIMDHTLDITYKLTDQILNSFHVFQMPRIWLDYCQFLMDQCRITRTRQVFDRALRALPITQHHRVWPLYLKFLKMYDIPETAVRVFRRYLKVSRTF
jgi:pre-mRNA-splicing factor SYF1